MGSGVATSGLANAQEEFRRWVVGELKQDLSKGINVDEFTSNLLSLPPDTSLITEAVHSNSTTIDSRHFAEEFIRRRKLADKGQIDLTKSASPSHHSAEGKVGGGGWSEVAKKGPVKEKEEVGGPNFKVVSKKKGTRR
ncbi:hypothetical protein LTR28_012764 [Elasticomyces elasticus]|nr:hypothetical protein LTR28_012764 [Elasticomyces elasticus]